MDQINDGTCLSSGNAASAGELHREWFTGPFIPPETGLRSAPVELKWSHRPQGWCRGWSPTSDSTSLVLLITGAMSLSFRGAAEGTVTLSRPGDYVMWCPGAEHDCLALKDCTVLTVRFGGKAD